MHQNPHINVLLFDMICHMYINAVASDTYVTVLLMTVIFVS
jgi:hypothetical protein